MDLTRNDRKTKMVMKSIGIEIPDGVFTRGLNFVNLACSVFGVGMRDAKTNTLVFLSVSYGACYLTMSTFLQGCYQL